MKNTEKDIVTRISEQIAEINLAAANYKQAKKMDVDLYSKIVDLQTFAMKNNDAKLGDLIKKLNQAHSAVSTYIDSQQ